MGSCPDTNIIRNSFTPISPCFFGYVANWNHQVVINDGKNQSYFTINQRDHSMESARERFLITRCDTSKSRSFAALTGLLG